MSVEEKQKFRAMALELKKNIPMSEDEERELCSIVRGNLLRSSTPKDIEESLIKKGLVIRVSGGLKATNEGNLLALNYGN
jgi:hypothetical protein